MTCPPFGRCGRDARLPASIIKHTLRGEAFRYPVDDQTLDLACALVHRYALRAYDAVQLAACLFLLRLSARDDLTFISADRRLLNAARAEGLTVLNPES